MALFSVKSVKKSDEGLASLIQRRRLQILVHSCLYYALNDTLITDAQFDSWGRELAKLQAEHPEVARKVRYAKEFAEYGKDDCFSGYDLDYRKPEIINKAHQLLRYRDEHQKI